jgi:transcriptional regulator with XRE-family HTH domain
MSTKKYKISEEIIARIFKAIQDKGLRQKEVAKKMGISESELAEMKAGRTRISFRLLECLHLNYGISIDEIITGRKKKDEIVNYTDLKEYMERLCL